MVETGYTLYGVAVGFHIFFTFTVAIFFAMSSTQLNKSDLDKLERIITFSPLIQLHQTTITVSVFSFLTFFSAAISSFIVPIDEECFFFGIITAVLSIFTIFADGAYILHSVRCISSVTEYNHKNAQKYIKESIEDLYNQGIDNFRKLSQTVGGDFYLYFEDIIAKWDEVENLLGKLNGVNQIITYSNIWGASVALDDCLRLTVDSSKNIINANFYFRFNDQTFTVPVATTTFTRSDEVPIKERYCWYIKDDTDIKCKNIKEESYYDDFSVDTIKDIPTLNENIVVGTYISHLNSDLDVNYRVSNFPSAFSLVDFDNFTYVRSATTSTNHFKVKGQRWVKGYINYLKDMYSKRSIDRFNGHFSMAPREVSSYSDYIDACDYYSDSDSFYSKVCRGSIQFEDIIPYLKSNYKDTYKGKVAKSVKSYYMAEALNDMKESSTTFYVLYNLAITHMVLQIVVLVFIIIGLFVILC